MSLFLISLISYLLGSIPFSYLVARFFGKNLYEVGSKNIGAANVYRATGKAEATILALIGDVGKGGLAVALAKSLACLGYNPVLGQALAAFFVVAGHNWPIFLKFKGGRGLASLAGVILFLKWQVLILVLIVIGFFIFLTEFIMKKGIKLEGSLKEKSKTLLSVFISQILGRVIGMVAAVILVFLLYPEVFKIAFGAVILTGAKHIKRTQGFLEQQKQ
jgi:glycerol-3-phosphate acyltransferase PlsY